MHSLTSFFFFFWSPGGRLEEQGNQYITCRFLHLKINVWIDIIWISLLNENIVSYCWKNKISESCSETYSPTTTHTFYDYIGDNVGFFHPELWIMLVDVIVLTWRRSILQQEEPSVVVHYHQRFRIILSNICFERNWKLLWATNILSFHFFFFKHR